MPAEKPPEPHQDATVPGEPELLDDGQEEVSSYTAIERGMVKDPLAMDPDLLRPLGVADRHDRTGPQVPAEPVEDS
ncbi:hypothetical protein [Phenylobacterium sp.]|uniref:hypothetical protein n=1 Tax=Phenylobacterium sp. TaxID=1871053 RepID=UPI00286E654F|nr:hypothetical protein [Phenylobacterium sp.]